MFFSVATTRFFFSIGVLGIFRINTFRVIGRIYNDSKSIDPEKTQNTDGKKESSSSNSKKQKLKEKGEENLKTNKKTFFSRKSKEKKATLDSNFSSHDSMDTKNKGENERGAGKVIYVCSGKYLQSGNGFTLTKILLCHK